MSESINAAVSASTETKSIWSRVKQTVSATTAAATKAADAWTFNKALPAVGYGIEWTIQHADQACGAAVRKEVELLQKYPNFTMLVSQSTVFRMAAAEHYKNATGKNTTSASEVVSTTM